MGSDVDPGTCSEAYPSARSQTVTQEAIDGLIQSAISPQVPLFIPLSDYMQNLECAECTFLPDC